MGFIDEIISIGNDINYMRYNKEGINFIHKLYAKYQIRKLKKLISKIREDEISTKLISEYADYYLQIFHMHSDKKNHIKQILSGQYGNAGSITMEFNLPEGYYGIVTVDFSDRYSLQGNYLFRLVGANSSMRVSDNKLDVSKLTIDDNIDMNQDILSLSRANKIIYFENYFIKEFTKEIKEFLYSNIDTKEISNGESGQ